GRRGCRSGCGRTSSSVARCACGKPEGILQASADRRDAEASEPYLHAEGSYPRKACEAGPQGVGAVYRAPLCGVASWQVHHDRRNAGYAPGEPVIMARRRFYIDDIIILDGRRAPDDN